MVMVNNKLEQLLEDTIVGMGLEWVGCEWANDGGRQVLRVYADAPGGITIDQCAQASRELGTLLDVEDSISGRYRLEVSSPGLERPLFRLADYQRFVGSRVRLRLHVPDEQGRRRFKGVITAVVDDKVEVALGESDEVLLLGCSQIEKASLIVDI